MTGLIRTLRPHQWVKNVFVAAPLVFARHLEDVSYLWREAVAVVAFCLLSGAVYAFNDVRDVEQDRAHPTKQHRPIASGQVSERTALIMSATLATVALGACLAVHWQLAMFAAIYFAQNIAYSIAIKHIAFLDVCSITLGFLLRVLAGAAAIDVSPSGWLLACTGLLATFLALGKRAHELAWSQRSGSTKETRAALAGYKLAHLRNAMFGLAVVTVGAYVMYALDAHTVEMFKTDRLVWSAPFVAIALVRFLYLALWYPKDDPPTEAMLRDPIFLVDLAAASATVLYIIYG